MERVHYPLRELRARAKELSREATPVGRVLIVDDENAEYCRQLPDLLPDCQFLLEPSPQSARKTLLSSLTDVVLLGLSTESCLFELLQSFKSLRPSTAVIVITACGSEELAVQSFRHGAIDYFTNPFALEELELSIRAVLEIRNKFWKAYKPLPVSGLQRALRYMETNFSSPIKLEHAAREAGMSVSCFERYLKNQTGMTFIAYLNSMRIAKARELLRTTSDSMLQIALFCGFGNQSHFNRVFRKITGTTPGAFRKADFPWS